MQPEGRRQQRPCEAPPQWRRSAYIAICLQLWQNLTGGTRRPAWRLAVGIPVSIAAAQHGRNPPAAHLASLLDDGGEGGCAGSLGDAVGVIEQDAHGHGDFVIRHHDYASDVPPDDLEHVRIRHRASHPVGDSGGRRARHRALPTARLCENSRFVIVIDGIYYAAALAGAGFLVRWLAGPWFAAPLWLLVAFCLYFFRDPERAIPAGPVAVAPADGKVVAVKP